MANKENKNVVRINNKNAIILSVFILLIVSSFCFTMGCGKKEDSNISSSSNKNTEEDNNVLSNNDKNKEDSILNENNANNRKDMGNTITDIIIGADNFASAKLAREKEVAKRKERLFNIINNKSISSDYKRSVLKEIADITEKQEKESAAELMLEARGFHNVIVSISGIRANVIVEANELSEQQVAKITDIVRRKTGIKVTDIEITPIAITE